MEQGKNLSKIVTALLAKIGDTGDVEFISDSTLVPVNILGTSSAFLESPKLNELDLVEDTFRYAEPVLPPATSVAEVTVEDSDKFFDNNIDTNGRIHLKVDGSSLNYAYYVLRLNVPMRLNKLVIYEKDVTMVGISYPVVQIAYEDNTTSDPTPSVYDYAFDSLIQKDRKLYIYDIDTSKKVEGIIIGVTGTIALPCEYEAEVYGIYLYTYTDNQALSDISSNIDVKLSTRASETTLSSIDGKITKCDTDNISGTVAIGGITDSVDIKTHSGVFGAAPSASTAYQMSFSMTGFDKGRIYIKADQALDVAIQVSFDGGSTWDDVDGLEILNADFNTTKANFIDVDRLMSFRVKYVTGTTAPTEVYVMLIKKT